MQERLAPRLSGHGSGRQFSRLIRSVPAFPFASTFHLQDKLHDAGDAQDKISPISAPAELLCPVEVAPLPRQKHILFRRGHYRHAEM